MKNTNTPKQNYENNVNGDGEKIVIDMMGKPCPMPVVETKKILDTKSKVTIIVKVDNNVAVKNLEKLAKKYEQIFSCSEMQANQFEVCIKTSGNKLSDDSVSEPCPVVDKKQSSVGQSNVSILITTRNLGAGSDELGAILMKGFIYSLTELSAPPKSIIFLNSGAYLTAKGSNTIPDLQTLSKQGVEIFTCGTCANFFGLTDSIVVGSIIDMFGITQKLIDSDKIISL